MTDNSVVAVDETAPQPADERGQVEQLVMHLTHALEVAPVLEQADC
jgi:hypothetical protein